MDVEDVGVTLKLIVVGDGQVGKTSLITRFCKNTFSQQYKRTLGVDFLEKTKYVLDLKTDVTFHLWDTAGQEEYHALTRKYYRGAQAAVLAFSMVDRASFDHLQGWMEMIRDECGEIPLVLVQNKTDLTEDRVVSDEEAQSLAMNWNVLLKLISVKENSGVGDVFEALAVMALKRKPRSEPEKRKGTSSTGSSSHSAGVDKVILTPKSQEKAAKRKRLFAYCSLL